MQLRSKISRKKKRMISDTWNLLFSDWTQWHYRKKNNIYQQMNNYEIKPMALKQSNKTCTFWEFLTIWIIILIYSGDEGGKEIWQFIGQKEDSYYWKCVRSMRVGWKIISLKIGFGIATEEKQI